MIHAVLFDLDGTLTDPKEGITRCMQHALAQLGLAVPPTEALVPYIGPPLQETFAQLLATDDRARVDAAIAHYRDRFAAAGMYENASETHESVDKIFKTIPLFQKPQKNRGKSAETQKNFLTFKFAIYIIYLA